MQLVWKIKWTQISTKLLLKDFFPICPLQYVLEGTFLFEWYKLEFEWVSRETTGIIMPRSKSQFDKLLMGSKSWERSEWNHTFVTWDIQFFCKRGPYWGLGNCVKYRPICTCECSRGKMHDFVNFQIYRNRGLYIFVVLINYYWDIKRIIVWSVQKFWSLFSDSFYYI